MEAEDCLSLPGLGVNVGDFCTPAWLSAESQGNLERPTPRFVMTLDVAPVQSRWSSTKDPGAQLGCRGHKCPRAKDVSARPWCQVDLASGCEGCLLL